MLLPRRCAPRHRAMPPPATLHDALYWSRLVGPWLPARHMMALISSRVRQGPGLGGAMQELNTSIGMYTDPACNTRGRHAPASQTHRRIAHDALCRGPRGLA